MRDINAALLTIALFAACHPVYAKETPNIIIIYTDDQGYGDVSALNPDSKFETPNIDRLAREGLTLTDGHSSDTVCTPSRYGLLTGRYSWRTELKRGVFGAERAGLIRDGRMTLASLLRDSGYATGMVGKWHLGMDFPGTRGARDWSQPVEDMPLDKAFDYFWGIPASMNYGVLAWFDGRHAAVPPTLYTRKKPNDIALADYRIEPPYQSEPLSPDDLETASDFVDSECLTRFTQKSIEWIRSRAEAARSGTPFFLYVAYTSPHKPVIPLEQFRGQGEAGAYGEFVIETDHHLGSILSVLDEEKLAENTMVIYTSDNGPENTWKERIERFGHHSSGIYRGGKRSIYEGGHRVPFFIRWPAKIKAGAKLDAPVSQTDLLATIAEMLGKSLPAGAGEDSNSFYEAALDPESAARRPAIVHHGFGGRFAIRSGDWKLVMEGTKESESRELYNLSTDPGESTDVIDQHPEISERLTAAITRIIENGRSSPGAAATNDTPLWPDLEWMLD